MARARIEIERQGLRLPYERVWDAMLKMKGPFTLAELHPRPAVTKTTTDKYTAALERAGHLRRLGGGEIAPHRGAQRQPVVYERVSRTTEPPRFAEDGKAATLGAARLAMWRAMRRLTGGFTADDLVRAANVQGVMTVSRETARLYAQALRRAGYLQALTERRSGSLARWRLIKDTGPHAPAITRRKCVFDRNTGTFADLETAQEVCDALE